MELVEITIMKGKWNWIGRTLRKENTGKRDTASSTWPDRVRREHDCINKSWNDVQMLERDKLQLKRIPDSGMRLFLLSSFDLPIAGYTSFIFRNLHCSIFMVNLVQSYLAYLDFNWTIC